MMKDSTGYLLFLYAIVIGISLASQAGVNAQLRTVLDSPIQAAFLSFLIGTIVLGVIVVIHGYKWITLSEASNVPWWAWLGGIFGAFNIAMSIYLAPKLGAVALAISVVSGQVFASMFFDQYGLLGYPKIEVSLGRVVGAIFLMFGVVMVSKT